MALFESYERREKQILACIKEYGINSIEECAEICKSKGLDIYKLVEGIQSVMIVAGLELTRTTSIPSSRSAFAACVPA